MSQPIWALLLATSFPLWQQYTPLLTVGWKTGVMNIQTTILEQLLGMNQNFWGRFPATGFLLTHLPYTVFCECIWVVEFVFLTLEKKNHITVLVLNIVSHPFLSWQNNDSWIDWSLFNSLYCLIIWHMVQHTNKTATSTNRTSNTCIKRNWDD